MLEISNKQNFCANFSAQLANHQLGRRGPASVARGRGGFRLHNYARRARWSHGRLENSMRAGRRG
jgi:hypothetical protein